MLPNSRPFYLRLWKSGGGRFQACPKGHFYRNLPHFKLIELGGANTLREIDSEKNPLFLLSLAPPATGPTVAADVELIDNLPGRVLSQFRQFSVVSLTAIRVYTNRATTDFYEFMFDELQRIKKAITGKVFGMKRFVPGGNLLVMNAEKEAAQVLGIARSIMKTNDPEYSGIPNDTPASLAATYFVKISTLSRAIHNFKGMVTAAQYDRLMDFMYIDSKERLNNLSKISASRKFRIGVTIAR
ncbi:hypothetical protein K438DRAFT_1992310 [Mycena galopus ATCC 62051]|nr:hypothetical protein K438DRAFT_1992310 [Mycena galopus ATCC 62051]